MTRTTRALIFGAGGQVARDLIPMLVERGTQPILADRLPPEETEGGRALSLYAEARNLPDWRSWWRVLDGMDEPGVRDLIEEIEPDVTYHLAALLSARCEENAGLCWRVNMTLFTNVLEALRSLASGDRRPKMIWPSSIAAFGPLPSSSHHYDAQNEYPRLPTTMYGVTKVASETLGTYYAEKHGVDFRSVRLPGLLNDAEPGGGSSDYANQMYFDAVGGHEPRPCFVGPEARIPFMYMQDAVRALIELAASEESKLTRRVYNIKAFSAPSAKEIEHSIARQVPGFEVRYEPDQRQDYVDSWPDDFDDRPALHDWGWQPEVNSMDQLTRRLLEDLRAKRSDLSLDPSPAA